MLQLVNHVTDLQTVLSPRNLNPLAFDWRFAPILASHVFLVKFFLWTDRHTDCRTLKLSTVDVQSNSSYVVARCKQILAAVVNIILEASARLD